MFPIFESDEDYLIPELPKKLTMGGEEDIMELLWHNGQVVAQSQNLRSVANGKPTAGREIRSSAAEEETTPSVLFMQEDEMSSWLHYPIDDNCIDRYLYSNDLLYPTPPSCVPITTAPSSLPPPPPPPPSVMIPSPRPPVVPVFRRVEEEPGQMKYPNFLHFSRPSKGRTPELTPSSSSKIVKQSIVDSNETPVVEAPESRASCFSDKPALVSAANIGFGGSMSAVGAAGTSSAGREIETRNLSGSSSAGTGGSGSGASAEPSPQKPAAATVDRKRKGIDTDDPECRSEDAEFEYADTKKRPNESTSNKRSRAAKVHNLSERRRRDRINEKMKALQELIPRCNKSDKASMLDEAIEYLKSLQLQIQMMSMGCSMVPVMFQGVQPYMPQLAMGMGMGMDRSMVPYPTGFPAPSTATAQLGQQFPVPGFTTAPAASQAANPSAPMMSSFESFPIHNPNQPQVPNFADPYQQYLGLHQTQAPLPQSQTGMPPIASEPISNKDVTNPDNHPTG